MSTRGHRGVRVFLTGATGFIGKVVLQELMRRRRELGVERVYLLIRPRRRLSATARFEQSVATSRCFSLLEPAWTELCRPVSGDMTTEGLGLSTEDLQLLQSDLTHVIHCAASIRFDLPLAKAADINITGALRTLRFVQGCAHVRRFVDVSTAYVTPHPGHGVLRADERLVDIPLDAEDTYRQILEGAVDGDQLLAATGHPSTYTLTKCLAEIILAKQRGETPLTLVRPSIVSACRRYPFPGWIDSHAAYAAFVSLLGTGHLRAVRANTDTVLDVVPCDDVADRILACAFEPSLQQPFLIRHASVGLARSGRTGDLARRHISFFRGSPHDRPPHLAFLGRSAAAYRLRRLLSHVIPLRAAQVRARLAGRPRDAREPIRMLKWLDYLDEQFHYFVHRTFEFRTAAHDTSEFELVPYLDTVSGGVSEHLLKRDPTEVPLHLPGGDLSWALRQPGANPTTRLMAYLVRKALRRAHAAVTFDERRMRAALGNVESGDFVILAPTHRSYLDFLITSLFCFAHPGLGLRLPRVAATDDFARIPIVGRMLEHAGAFYIRRGTGVPDPELTRQIERLVRGARPLSFYPEGTRSRGRRFLQPKRGILRAIQQSGQSAVVIPISISYDRIAEEIGFARELRDGHRHRGGLRGLLTWYRALRRGQVQIGRVHMRAGEPVRIGPYSDIHGSSRRVVSELQRHTVPSTFHLRVFAESHPRLAIDPGALRSEILKRGGRVLDSPLDDRIPVDRALEQTYQSQWMHLFYADALALHPQNAAIAAHVRRNGFWYPASTGIPEPLTTRVVEGLFAPVCRDFECVAAAVERMPADGAVTAHELVARTQGLSLINVEDALAALVEEQHLVADRAVHRWARGKKDLGEFRSSCAWTSSVEREQLLS